METKQIAEALGISSYPDALNSITPNEKYNYFADIQWLSDIEARYTILDEYYKSVCDAVTELQTNKLLLAWGNIVTQYISSCTASEARLVPIPARDGTLSRDFLPLLILLTQLQNGIREYRRRNMPEDMIRRNLFHFKDGVSIVEYRTGRPGIDQTYFNWLIKFVKGTIFNSHGFNFEIKELPSNTYALQNKKDHTIHPVLDKTVIHRSGNILNNAGCTDEENSFTTYFSETDNAFIAFPCINGLVSSQPQNYSKDTYSLILKPGDIVLSVHIPRGTDISHRNATASLSDGFCEATQFYPELTIKALHCHSWLLDPKLANLLNPNTNIPQFGNIFTRYPAKSAGKEVFSFVFPRQIPFTDLPENTSLERALKNHYINGNYILAYSGIALPQFL